MPFIWLGEMFASASAVLASRVGLDIRRTKNGETMVLSRPGPQESHEAVLNDHVASDRSCSLESTGRDSNKDTRFAKISWSHIRQVLRGRREELIRFFYLFEVSDLLVKGPPNWS